MVRKKRRDNDFKTLQFEKGALKLRTMSWTDVKNTGHVALVFQINGLNQLWKYVCNPIGSLFDYFLSRDVRNIRA